VGRWPWSRAVQARLLEALGKAGVKGVVLDIVLSEEEKSLPAWEANRLLSRYEQLGLPQVGPQGEEFYEELQKLRGSDGEADARFGEALQHIPRSVIATFFIMSPGIRILFCTLGIITLRISLHDNGLYRRTLYVKLFKD